MPIKKRKVNEIVNLHHSHWCRFTSTFPENMIFTFQFEDDALDNLKSPLSSRTRYSRTSMKFPSCLASTIMRMPIVLRGFQTPRIRRLHGHYWDMIYCICARYFTLMLRDSKMLMLIRPRVL